jgi:uncharacterized protein YcaQ
MLCAVSLLAERLTAQLLAGEPARDPLTVTERLLAIQAQDPRGARLAIRARSTVASAAEIDRALTSERSLVVTWLNRGTLHMVRSEDYWWLQALSAPRLRTANARRLGQEGVEPDDAERAMTAIERALAEEGPLGRERLRGRLASAGVRTQGQAFVHLLVAASMRGLIVRGPMMAGKHAFVLVRDWLGEGPQVDRAQALAELARRYLAGHGPAQDRDLARWAGLPLGDARAGLAAIASECSERADGSVHLKRRPAAAPLPAPRLLGPFEPLLLGWASRAEVLGDAERHVVSGGVFRALVLVRGRAVGTWAIARGAVALDLFGAVTRAERAALEADAGLLMRFFD